MLSISIAEGRIIDGDPFKYAPPMNIFNPSKWSDKDLPGMSMGKGCGYI